jgi:protocatechuate 3,4-dioxygenase beta subunit
MQNDDVFSVSLGRRQILGGATALALLGLTRSLAASRLAPSLLDCEDDSGLDVGDLIDADALQSMCVLTPSETQGPYYLNLNLIRSDITEGKPGIPTRLFLNVVRASDCTPIPNAACDVWHCDALGVYSGIPSLGTAGQTFLRGIQFTDASGMTYFDTIYPGWYPGRTTHIHVKVRPTSTSELTSQIYFPQSLSTRIAGRPPYSSKGINPTTNNGDPLFLPETVVNVLGVLGGKLHLQLTIGVA